MIIRPLSFVFGAFTSLFLFYLCILNYEIAHRYVVASQSVLSNQCTPPSAGHINVTTSIGLDLDTNATSHLTEAETVPLESQISNATLCFEKILVVNLRERTDRRDTLTLTAAIGNIHLDFLPTVRGESVSPKARPNLSSPSSNSMPPLPVPCRPPLPVTTHHPAPTEQTGTYSGSVPAPLRPHQGEPKIFQNPHYDEPLAARSNRLTLQHPMSDPRTRKSMSHADESLRKLVSPSHYNFEAHEALACLTAYAVTQQSARALMGFLLDLDEPTDLAVSRYCARHDGFRPVENIEQISNQADEWLDDKGSTTVEELETRCFSDDIGNSSKTLSTSEDRTSSDEPSLPSPKTESNISDIDDTSLSFSPHHVLIPRIPPFQEVSTFFQDLDLPESSPDQGNLVPPDNTPALSNHTTADDSQLFPNTPIPARLPNNSRKRCIAVWSELFGQHRATGAYAKESDTGNAGKEAGNRETGKTAKIVESAVGSMERELGWWVDDVDWETAMQQG